MSDARTALVTGGAARLGRAIVEELARAGWQVAFTYRNSHMAAADLERSLAAEGSEVSAVHADLGEPAAWSELAATMSQRFDRLDALINSAAVFPATPVGELTEAAFFEVMRTNLNAPLFLTLACAPMLRASRGAVVNIADIYGLFPLKRHLAYSVSKAALIAATRSLAVELAPEVRVNAVAPGIAAFPDHYDQATRERLLARTLLGREGGAAEIAGAVRYLLEGAVTMTGQVLVLDGGRTVTI
ncbi:MAG: SDR family oxidoreductase [Acidobacteriota bacterium]